MLIDAENVRLELTTSTTAPVTTSDIVATYCPTLQQQKNQVTNMDDS